LRRAIELDPAIVTAYDNLGIALERLGRFKESEAQYRKALELDCRHAPALQHLGELLRGQNCLDEARQSFESALKIDPSLTQVRIDLADILLEQGEFLAAAQGYQAAIATGWSGPATYINLGIALKEMGDVEGSLDAFEHPVKRDPQSPEAHLSLASALLDCARLDEALARAREAIRLRSDFPQAHLVYGMVLAAQGDWIGAVGSAARSMAPQSSPEQILAMLGAKLLNIGLPERVRECFQILLEREPDDVGARHVIASLSAQNPDHPDEEYIRRLFDGYADTFNRHLTVSLGYNLPREMVADLLAVGSRAVPWDVLDLGCGTGLVGFELAAHNRSLVGVDLSPKIIERARRCKAYTLLKAANLMSVLDEERPNGYDVVSAADVFIYVGKLDSLVPAVSKVGLLPTAPWEILISTLPYCAYTYIHRPGPGL
jgi:predicted TPR repeat methyltransferase